MQGYVTKHFLILFYGYKAQVGMLSIPGIFDETKLEFHHADDALAVARWWNAWIEGADI